MTKYLIDIDDALLAAAQRELNTNWCLGHRAARIGACDRNNCPQIGWCSFPRKTKKPRLRITAE